MITSVAAAMSRNDTVPSLKRLALLRATLLLFEKQDIKSKALKCSTFVFDTALVSDYVTLHYRDKVEMESFQMTADEEISQLFLPVTLKEDMSRIIWPVCLQVLQWLKYHSKVLRQPIDELQIPFNNLCWTVHGRINKKKTAVLIVNDERVCITTRYVMACIYCLEDDVRTLWKQIPKEDFMKSSVMNDLLVRFWTLNTDPLHDPKPTLELAADSLAMGRKAAIEYFALKSPNFSDWNMLFNVGFATPVIISLRYPEQDWFETLLYVLSKMNEEEQLKHLERRPSMVLLTVLWKPGQRIFLEMVQKTRDLLSAYSFSMLLKHILHQCIKVGKSYDYIEIFQEFWNKASLEHKAYVRTHSKFGALYLDLMVRFMFPLHRNERIFLKRARSFIAAVKQYKRNCSDFRKGHWEILQFIIQAGLVTKHSLFLWKNLAGNNLSAQATQRLRLMELILDDGN